MRKSAALITLVVLIAIGAGGFALTRNSKDTKKTSTTSPTPSTTTSEPPAPSPTTTSPTTNENTTSVITYSDDGGFIPASLTVKSGGTITVKNVSTKVLEFSSDPHPVHTANSELNLNPISAGGSRTFTVTKAGTWGIHNHLRAADTGTLIVE